MDAGALRRLIEGHEIAHARELAAMETPVDPASSWAAAMELWDLSPTLFEDPPDEIRERDVASARSSWGRLREAMAT